MRRFDYSNIPEDLLSHEIMNLISAIHDYKGKQDLFIEAKPAILQAMNEIARIQSTGASNRKEGYIIKIGAGKSTSYVRHVESLQK